MADCKKCMSLEKKNGRNCSLINIYQNNKFCKNIPSIWTDWFNRLDSKIMIIGQDWGPYNDMKKLKPRLIVPIMENSYFAKLCFIMMPNRLLIELVELKNVQ